MNEKEKNLIESYYAVFPFELSDEVALRKAKEILQEEESHD